MTQMVEVVDAECHGSSLFLLMHQTGFVMSSSAISGIQMVMLVSVVMERTESFVLIPTSGQHTTEMTQMGGVEAVGCHGNYDCDY